MDYEIYDNLIGNNDPNNHYYQIQPRLGAFEVSCGGDLLFSKQLSKHWPNWNLVADKCVKLLDYRKDGISCEELIAGYSLAQAAALHASNSMGSLGSAKNMPRQGSQMYLSTQGSQSSLHGKQGKKIGGRSKSVMSNLDDDLHKGSISIQRGYVADR